MRQLLLLTCEIFVTRPDVSGRTHTKNWSLEFKKTGGPPLAFEKEGSSQAPPS